MTQSALWSVSDIHRLQTEADAADSADVEHEREELLLAKVRRRATLRAPAAGFVLQGLGPEEESMDQVRLFLERQKAIFTHVIRCYRKGELTWIVSARAAFGTAGLLLDEPGPGEQEDDAEL